MMNVIAIDGPAASGKSSVATAVAEALNAVHINTGSMYRAIGYKTVLAGIDPVRNPEAFSKTLASVQMRFVRQNEGDPELEVDGEFPGEKLRTEAASAAASSPAASAHAPGAACPGRIRRAHTRAPAARAPVR